MIYSTKGTVQIVFNAKAPTFEVIITPTHSSKILAGGKDFILFIQTPVPSPPPPATLLLPNDTKFTVADHNARSILIAAASGASCVELQIDDSKRDEIIHIVFPAPNK